jgi:Family of unknown function (DUF6232)
MRTYYRSPDVVVTSDLFMWQTIPVRTVQVRDLRRIAVVQRPQDLRSPRVVVSVSIALIVLSASVAVGVTAGSTSAWVVGAVASMAALGYSWSTIRGAPRVWELTAAYRGQSVTLFASTDAQVFNRVTRALRRAVEDSRPMTGDVYAT